MSEPDEFDEHVRAFHAQRDRLAKLHDRLRVLTAEATSPRGLLTVVIGHDGGLAELTFNDTRFQRLAPAKLAELVVRTIEQARAALAAKVAGLGADNGSAADDTEPSETPGFDELMRSHADWEQLLSVDVVRSRSSE